MTSEELSLIIKRVLLEIEQNKTRPTLLLHAVTEKGTAHFKAKYAHEYSIFPWAENIATAYNILGVESLSVAQIGRIVSLAPQSPIEEEILEALLNGKPVWVLTNSPTSSTGALKAKIASNEKLIQDYGVVFLQSQKAQNHVDFTAKMLITEKDLAHIPDKTKILVKNPIFTPLAMDRVRMSQLEIERK